VGLSEIMNTWPRASTALVAVLAVLFFYKLSVIAIKKLLFRHVRTKRQQANVYLFMHIWRYFFFFIMLIILISIFTDSLQWVISTGFIFAAFIWALQKPIAGVFAWLIIVTKKPFKIGDLVSIGESRGEVYDITLTHIYLAEVGETTTKEVATGGIVMIPNSVLFEQPAINYTFHDEYVLDTIGIVVDYKSNLALVKRICEAAAKKVTKEFIHETAREPITNIAFLTPGVLVEVKYYTKIGEKEAISSQISEEILKQTKKRKIKIAK
jgi:small-conductance mechanosensitive channel